MADTKITSMTAASTLGGTEVVAGVQTGTNVKITANQLKTWASNAPTLVTPTLGVATATSVNKVTLTAPSAGSTLTIADGKTLTANTSGTLAGGDAWTLAIAAGKTLTGSTSGTLAGGDAWTLAIAAGKTLTVSNTGTIAGGDSWTLAIAASKTLTVSNILTLAGTDSTVMTFPTTSATIARTDAANTFTGTQSFSGTTTFTVAASGPILKQGANGRVGTFVANGVTPVSVSNSSIAITDAIIISLNTVGGTVGALPAIQTITGTSGFTVAATIGDTSTYNYAIIKNA